MPKIERIDIHHLSTPIDPPRRTGNHLYSSLENVLVEVVSEGEVGQGYAFSFNARQAQAIAILARDLVDVVRDLPADNPAASWHAMWRHINFIGQAGPPVKALAMIDTALWDLKGKLLARPVHRLLGTVRDTVDIYPTGGFLSDPIGDVIDELTGFRQQGFTRCKIKVGRPDWRIDVERVRQIRSALGDDFTLMVDVNQAWDVQTAIAAGTEMAALGVSWLEEPVIFQDIVGTARVAQALPLTVACGESNFTRHELLPLVSARACGNLMLNLMRCGGPTEFLAVAQMASGWHCQVSAHTFTETSAQLIATLPNGTLAEYLPGWWDILFNEPLDIKNGVLFLHDRPGFGRTFARDVIDRYAN